MNLFELDELIHQLERKQRDNDEMLQMYRYKRGELREVVQGRIAGIMSGVSVSADTTNSGILNQRRY
tara:strand:- start:1155 stop:1355 length:201 start_codon:yes stop_codon:yes gene_type:complete